jgi:hypothetical protein
MATRMSLQQWPPREAAKWKLAERSYALAQDGINKRQKQAFKAITLGKEISSAKSVKSVVENLAEDA